VRQRFLPDAALPYPAYGLVLLFAGCGVALSGLRFGVAVCRMRRKRLIRPTIWCGCRPDKRSASGVNTRRA
ncbi:hypothetical protein, partial [Pseudocitrobacter faecalis]|uniref:hypothetical protein n=1 Tax=Pseudocitrobacter faecalis TaxID=1398493 RepID=UPI003B9FD6DC